MADGKTDAVKMDAPKTEEATVRKDIVPPQYRKKYQELGGTCGDFIATELSAMVESGGVDSLNAVKAENNIPAARWSGLNNGQQRMNLSNTLRAAFLRGEPIRIQGKEYSLHTLKEEFGDLDAANEKQVGKFLEFVSMPNDDRNRRAIKRVFHDLPQKATERAKREEERAAKAKAKEDEKAAKAAAKEEAAKAAAEAKASEGDAKPKKGRSKKADADAPTKELAEA